MKNIYDANLEPKFQDRIVANLTRDQWRQKIKLRFNKIINNDANLVPKFQDRIVANLRDQWRETIKLRFNKINK